jgi:putative transposase
MTDRTHPLPIKRQAEALGMARSTVYALPRPIPERDLELTKRIDRLHLRMPYAGSRMLRDLLAQDGVEVGRKHVATLMKRMGIEALYRKPKTTQKHPQHRVYPYLLRGLSIDRPYQGYAMDITYIPMARGFVYLVAVLDWYSRKILSWRVSITMGVHFCFEALEEAMALYGAPQIMNTDQGSPFTSQAFTGLLKEHGIRISVDGKGAWRDNVFIERLRRSVKYEELYLHAYDTASDSRTGVALYFDLYNRRRPHSSLKRQTPDQVYFSRQPLTLAA